MGNAILDSRLNPKPKAAVAVAASMGELLAIATLVAQYEQGEDLSVTLEKLYELQKLKKRNGLSPALMRAAADDPCLRRARELTGAVARASRILAERAQRRA